MMTQHVRHCRISASARESEAEIDRQLIRRNSDIQRSGWRKGEKIGKRPGIPQAPQVASPSLPRSADDFQEAPTAQSNGAEDSPLRLPGQIREVQSVVTDILSAALSTDIKLDLVRSEIDQCLFALVQEQLWRRAAAISAIVAQGICEEFNRIISDLAQPPSPVLSRSRQLEEAKELRAKIQATRMEQPRLRGLKLQEFRRGSNPP
jgi:hypothetical protein